MPSPAQPSRAQPSNKCSDGSAGPQAAMYGEGVQAAGCVNLSKGRRHRQLACTRQRAECLRPPLFMPFRPYPAWAPVWFGTAAWPSSPKALRPMAPPPFSLCSPPAWTGTCLGGFWRRLTEQTVQSGMHPMHPGPIATCCIGLCAVYPALAARLLACPPARSPSALLLPARPPAANCPVCRCTAAPCLQGFVGPFGRRAQLQHGVLRTRATHTHHCCLLPARWPAAGACLAAHLPAHLPAAYVWVCCGRSTVWACATREGRPKERGNAGWLLHLPAFWALHPRHFELGTVINTAGSPKWQLTCSLPAWAQHPWLRFELRPGGQLCASHLPTTVSQAASIAPLPRPLPRHVPGSPTLPPAGRLCSTVSHLAPLPLQATGGSSGKVAVFDCQQFRRGGVLGPAALTTLDQAEGEAVGKQAAGGTGAGAS